jgi:Tfp pilus assembly protein PilF
MRHLAGAVLALGLLAAPLRAEPSTPPLLKAEASPDPALLLAGASPDPALAIIDTALAEGRFDAAAEVLQRTLPLRPGPELQLRVAELALARGALAEAATGFADLAADPAVAATAQQGLGITQLQQGNLVAARAALDAALAADAGLLRAWNARAVVADRSRDFVAADAAYARALALDPRAAMVRANQGYSLLLRGRHADAEAALVAALAIDSGLAPAATNLRLARAMQGRYRDAFAGSTRAGLAADLNTVGFAAMARGDYAVAEAYLNRALALNPRFDPVAFANLAYLKSITDPLGTGVGEDLTR